MDVARALEKHAPEITSVREPIRLGAYRNVLDGLLVYVEYEE